MANKISVDPKNHTVGVTINPLAIQIDLEEGEYFDVSNDVTTVVEFERDSDNSKTAVVTSSIDTIRSSYIECTISFLDPQGTYDVAVTQTATNNAGATPVVWNGDDVFIVS